MLSGWRITVGLSPLLTLLIAMGEGVPVAEGTQPSTMARLTITSLG